MTNKLTDTGLKKQIARLKCLPRGEERPWGTDKEPGLRDELLRVLWEQAVSDEHATRIIDKVMDTPALKNVNGVQQLVQFCPGPAELIATAQDIPERVGILREPDGTCVDCGGSGWKQTVRGGYSGVEQCRCVMVTA